MSAAAGDEREFGWATVEFLAALILLTTLFLASMEIGLYVYVRNLAQAAAVEAARYGAPVGRGVRAASERIDELLPAVLGGYAKGARARATSAGGLISVEVQGRVTPSLPLLPELPFEVEGWAFEEEAAIGP